MEERKKEGRKERKRQNCFLMWVWVFVKIIRFEGAIEVFFPLFLNSSEQNSHRMSNK